MLWSQEFCTNIYDMKISFPRTCQLSDKEFFACCFWLKSIRRRSLCSVGLGLLEMTYNINSSQNPEASHEKCTLYPVSLLVAEVLKWRANGAMRSGMEAIRTWLPLIVHQSLQVFVTSTVQCEALLEYVLYVGVRVCVCGMNFLFSTSHFAVYRLSI